MIYQVFNFKSLKIVLAKTGADSYFGYSVDTKYPEFNRPLIRGSIKEVVEVCIYLYQARLLAAINCEGYEVPSCNGFDPNSDSDIRDWTEYVLNRYLLDTFDLCYEHRYLSAEYPYVDDAGVPCTLCEYTITILHWDGDHWVK